MLKRFSCLFLAAVLTGCGGGESQSAVDPVLNYPIDSVLMKLASRGQVFSGKYTSATGAVRTLQATYSAIAADQFKREQVVASGGATQSTQQDIVTYDHVFGGFKVQSWTNDLGTFTSFSTGSQNPAPLSAAPGTSGTLAEVRLGDFTQATFNSRSLTWALTSVSVNTADLCIGYNYASEWGGGTNSDCFLINSAGEILGYKGISRFSVAHVSANETYQ